MKNKIGRIIREKNITHDDLAKVIGVNREYINLIINRKITPTVILGARIADALGVPMEELFIFDW